MKISFNQLKRQYDLYASEYENAALNTMRSGWYILGNELASFEKEFSKYMGVNHCVGVNSGLDALTLAVRCLDIGPGDEVIVPGNTYIASVLGITENGAKPVFVEPDHYFGIDSDRIEAAITFKTKAILPVHLYGQACNMGAICRIAEKYGLYIIEDCAQSHGSKYKGKYTGTFGTIGCFSFYPTKPLGALGDAGALVTNNDEIARKLRMLRNYGSDRKYVNPIMGKNTRMDEIQASVLKVSLAHLKDGNNYRNKIAEKYLAGINNPAIVLPDLREYSDHVYHVFPILCKQRDKLQAYLKENGIDTLCHYPIPPYLQDCYAGLGYKSGDFPVTEEYACQELSLPIYTGMPFEEVDYVINVLNYFDKGVS